MSYFDPCQDLEEVFLNFNRQSFCYPMLESPFKNLNLDINLNFDEQQFDYELENKTKEDEDQTLKNHSSCKIILKKKRIFKPRYQKNICGYILKKVFRAFVSPSYQCIANNICQKYCANLDQAMKFCLDKMQKLNGISHLYGLLMPTTKEQILTKLALVQFIQWFVRERYLRHLIFQGKMSNKKIYIDFKNYFFPKEIMLLRKMIVDFSDRQ